MKSMGRWIFPVFILGWAASSEAFVPSHLKSLPNQEIQIRVRLSDSSEVSRVRGYDLEFYSPEGMKLIQKADQTTEWRLTCGQKMVFLQNIKSRKTIEISGPVEVRTPAGFIRYQNQPYRDQLTIYPDSLSGCEVVNRVSLEKYLDGLVNAEFSSKWDAKAVGAQVIAARTYALYRMEEVKNSSSIHFDVDATEKDQVYDGSIREDYHAARVVEDTKGQVLLTALSTGVPVPMKAFYHSTCGGKTTLPERVWGMRSPGFKKTVPCPFCRVSPSYSWSARFTQGELESLLRIALKNRYPSIAGRYLHSVQPIENASSQRMDSVLLEWSGGLRFKVSGNELRMALGAKKLKSTHFRIVSLGVGISRTWQILGRGNGHGVGMCQWGAKVMGEKGFTTTQILKHYYPDAIIKKLW